MSEPSAEDIKWLEDRGFKRLPCATPEWLRFDAADPSSITMRATFAWSDVNPNCWYVSVAHHDMWGQSPQEAYECINSNLARAVKHLALAQANVRSVLEVGAESKKG